LTPTKQQCCWQQGFTSKANFHLAKAAELAGYSKRTFMELLSRYNVPVFNYDPNELANDVKNAGNYHIRH